MTAGAYSFVIAGAGIHCPKITCSKREVLSPLQNITTKLWSKKEERFEIPNQHSDDRFQQLFFM